MKFAASVALGALLTASAPFAQTSAQDTAMTKADIHVVSPALDRYARETNANDLWKRGDLNARDRSVVTLAALIARSDALDLGRHIALALDNGVTPAEISEIVTHLAFYSGWSAAMNAVAAAKKVFTDRKIAAGHFRPRPSRSCRSTRRQKPNARRASTRASDRPCRASHVTQRTSFSAISGFAPTSSRAIAALSQ